MRVPRSRKTSSRPVSGSRSVGSGSVAVTSYYRSSDDPPHTSIFPDSRFYTYASFDKGKAYGMELKVDVPRIANSGL